MLFKKKNNQDYSGKKYLLIIFMLILLVAIVLGISDLFKEKSENNEISVPSFDQILEDNQANIDSYIAKKMPSINEGDRVIGNINAPLKIFVYEDYNDEFSAQFSDTISRILSENNNKVAFVLRPYIGATSESKTKAISLVCAFKNGNWAQTRDYFFDSLLNKENIEKVDYNTDCLSEEEKIDKIEEFKKESENFGVYGSPTIFIGKEVIVGARPYDNYINSEGEEIEGMNKLITTILAEIE